MSTTIRFTKRYSSKILWDKTIVPNGLDDVRDRLLAVVDSNAMWYFKQTISPMDDVPYFTFSDPDETKKSQSTVNSIHDFLFEKKADRKSVILVVGGGITLDTAGYAASIYKRGIDWIAVPTTLLAQVDASVGGKTAINHPVYGKNVIGSFHPPVKVLIDPSSSLTWDDELRLEGIAEMYKIFKVFDDDSLKRLLRLREPTEVLTRRSIVLKAKVARVDPYEQNLRAILNYGHTFAHAIESLENDDNHPRKLPHGIAVSIGMRIENWVAHIIGVMSEDDALRAESELDSLGFPRPTKLPEFESMLDLLIQDKKAETGQVNLCLVDGKKELGFEAVDPRIGVNVAHLEAGYKTYLSRRAS